MGEDAMITLTSEEEAQFTTVNEQAHWLFWQ
jgi:hypothetical protein